MKFTDYPKVKSLEKDRTFLIDGGGGAGTSQIEAEDAYLALAETVDADPTVVHRNIYRGKNLGTHITDEQLAAIRDGSFKDLYVGDYWETNDIIFDNQPVKWRIADINYFYNGININQIQDSHLLIMPDYPLMMTKFNPTLTTEGSYVNSDIRMNKIPEIAPLIYKVFNKDNIKSCKMMLTNSIDSSNLNPNGYAWFENCTIELPSLMMITGQTMYTTWTNPIRVNEDAQCNEVKGQLALFRLNPQLISNRISSDNSFWTRTLCGSNRSLTVYTTGRIGADPVNTTEGLRPYFLVG